MPSRISRRSPGSLAAAVALMALAAVLSVLHVRAYTALSPLDELQHVDYLDQASRLDFVHNGERVGQLAMREQACRTVDSPRSHKTRRIASSASVGRGNVSAMARVLRTGS